MVLHDIGFEQSVEPVGIAHFSLTQISVAGRFGVLKGKRTGNWIIGIQQVIHLTVYTAVGSSVCSSEVQEHFCFHFLVNTHLFLGVHNVKLTVTGFQTHSKFTRVVDTAHPGLTFLCGYYNHTSHGTGSVN